MADITNRYERAAHALQSAIKVEQELDRAEPNTLPSMVPDTSSGSPKHLRVGLDLRAADHVALVRLLMATGVITEAEYLEAVTVATEQEAATATERVSMRLGRPVTFA